MTYIFLAFFGLAMGSFFGVVAERLSTGKNLGGRSRCDFCGKTLQAADLIPIVSFVAHRGKSRCCKKKLSFKYPIIEATTSLAYILVWTSVGAQPFLSIMVLYTIISCAIIIIFADLHYHIIPDAVIVILTGVIFAKLLLEANLVALAQNFAGGLLLAGILGSLYLATKGKGMGLGDVKLAFPIGLLLGPIQGFLALYLAFIFGGLWGGLLLLTGKRKLKSMIAFGPFLILGMLVMVGWGDFIAQWVRKLFT